MKTFNDFLKEQHVIEEEGLRDFLSQHGLEDDWKTFRNQPKPIVAPPAQAKGWKIGPDEGLRDMNRIMKGVVDQTRIVNKFGIEDIEFEPISREQVSTGFQCALEATGQARARNQEHVMKQLRELIVTSKKPLMEKGIYLVDKIDRLNVSQGVEEGTNMDEPAVGLVQTLRFSCVMQAVINSKKNPALGEEAQGQPFDASTEWPHQ